MSVGAQEQSQFSTRSRGDAEKNTEKNWEK
jgi:hypothetical protein